MESKNDKIIVQIDEDLEDLIPMFLENRTNDIAKIKNAIKQQDYNIIRTIGHSMKGTGGGYGFDEISSIGAVIESSALKKDADSIEKMLDKLVLYLKSVEVVFVSDV